MSEMTAAEDHKQNDSVNIVPAEDPIPGKADLEKENVEMGKEDTDCSDTDSWVPPKRPPMTAAEPTTIGSAIAPIQQASGPENEENEEEEGDVWGGSSDDSDDDSD